MALAFLKEAFLRLYLRHLRSVPEEKITGQANHELNLGMLISLTTENPKDKSLHRKSYAQAWCDLALRAKSSSIRANAANAVRRFAMHADKPELLELFAQTLEKLALKDSEPQVRQAAGTAFSHLALFYKMDDTARAAKVLAINMGDTDKKVRQYAAIALAQGYHTMIHHIDDWNNVLKPIFNTAADQHGIDVAEKAELSGRIEQTVEFWKQRIAATQTTQPSPENS